MSVGTRVLAIFLGAMLLASSLQTPARADVVCDRITNECRVEDGGGGGGGGSGGGEPPKVPLCSSFPPEAVPEDPPEPDWIFIECRLSSMEEDTIGLWVPPRESAEQLAWLLIARLQLKPVEIGLTPLDPDVMTAVGIPVWLWVDNPSRTS
ncbi:MAG: hypothetical protein WAQ75_06415, partial [Propionicimonas sp.]